MTVVPHSKPPASKKVDEVARMRFSVAWHSVRNKISTALRIPFPSSRPSLSPACRYFFYQTLAI
jgi:hypothetical protein